VTPDLGLVPLSHAGAPGRDWTDQLVDKECIMNEIIGTLVANATPAVKLVEAIVIAPD
jgi:hypothetical protein